MKTLTISNLINQIMGSKTFPFSEELDAATSLFAKDKAMESFKRILEDVEYSASCFDMDIKMIDSDQSHSVFLLSFTVCNIADGHKASDKKREWRLELMYSSVQGFFLEKWYWHEVKTDRGGGKDHWHEASFENFDISPVRLSPDTSMMFMLCLIRCLGTFKASIRRSVMLGRLENSENDIDNNF